MFMFAAVFVGVVVFVGTVLGFKADRDINTHSDVVFYTKSTDNQSVGQ